MQATNNPGEFKDYVKTIIRDPESVVKDSYMNCHAKGLHSIMLINTPGQVVRLFYTDHDHVLWKNEPTNFADEGLSIGFHPHRNDITIKVVKGFITNWVITTTSANLSNRPIVLNRYLHESAIVQKTKKPKFTFLNGNINFITKRIGVLSKTLCTQLGANELHTIGVSRGQEAAWLVIEGNEAKHYDPICYSNTNLERLDSRELYLPVTEEWVSDTLTRAFF